VGYATCTFEGRLSSHYPDICARFTGYGSSLLLQKAGAVTRSEQLRLLKRRSNSACEHGFGRRTDASTVFQSEQPCCVTPWLRSR